MVELAIVIVLLLLIVGGSVSFGRAFWYADALTKAVRDGARLLSSWPDKGSIRTKGVEAATTLTVISAKASNVGLVASNVVVECSNPGSAFNFSEAYCVNGTAPANVRVRITGFSVNLDEWFPFIGVNGPISFGGVALAPQSTMRYLR